MISLDWTYFEASKSLLLDFTEEQIKGDLKEEEGGCRRHKCLQKTATWH